jgi:hypothetical protein
MTADSEYFCGQNFLKVDSTKSEMCFFVSAVVVVGWCIFQTKLDFLM